jgi:hypothetical protein
MWLWVVGNGFANHPFRKTYMEKKSKAYKRIEFTPPPDFAPPENIEEGKDWDLVCSFRTKPDGTVCMTKLGDLDLPGYGSKEDHDEDGVSKEKPDYKEYVNKLGLSEGMGESGAPGPKDY